MDTLPVVGENEYVVRIPEGQTPDGEGRIRFAAYWRDDSAPQGVRGQVFYKRLEDFGVTAFADCFTVRIED